MLWALALEGLSAEDQQELLSLIGETDQDSATRIARVKQLYNKADVFEQAHRLVDKHQSRAEEIADTIEPEELRRLLYYLVDTVLDRPQDTTPTIDIIEPTSISDLTFIK